MHELISLPLILRDMSLHREKYKTVPVTLPLSLFLVFIALPPNPLCIIPDIAVWKFKGKKATESLKYFSLQCPEQVGSTT